MSLKSAIDGYKMYIGGAGFILWGISDILIGIYEGTHIDFNIALGKIMGGWSIIGGRSAMDKIIPL